MIPFMAAPVATNPPLHFEISIYGNNNAMQKQSPEEAEENGKFNSSQRGQWLRAAVLGANDGLVSIASLMMGVGAVKNDVKAMLLAGCAGSIAGACSMAIGEFVSVYTQLDIEVANPLQAALASALAFSVGAVVPLLAAAFVRRYKMRLGMVAAAASLALVVFGGLGAALGRTSAWRSCARVLVGGWMAMAITFGMTKVIGTSGI